MDEQKQPQKLPMTNEGQAVSTAHPAENEGTHVQSFHRQMPEYPPSGVASFSAPAPEDQVSASGFAPRPSALTGVFNSLPPSGRPQLSAPVVPTVGASASPPSQATAGIVSHSESVPRNQSPHGGGQMRELRVEDALLYLDDVKREFQRQPKIYNEFLSIMKNFKTAQVDTPGVIKRVSKLFKGYNNLILGFNTFLPDGYKISLSDLEEQDRQEREKEERMVAKQQQAAAAAAAAARKPAAAPVRRPPPPAPQHQAVEFDHAISYVTKIKRRFGKSPEVYHTFLDILHTYQKEQRGIKEVLEQVANLFQDHPDLLKEFTFFLPDAVQEQAKERLHRAAAESETRIAARSGKPQATQKLIDMTRSGASDRKRTSDSSSPDSNVYNSAVERQFFDTAREALSTFSRDGGQAWAEFLKCMDMYAQEILSRSEMLQLVEELLGKNVKLFEEFKRILNCAGAATGNALPVEDSWYSVPLAEIDFSRCRRCTPSYRALPRDYAAPPCSDRTAEEDAVLNDVWVSLPVGSEESYTFRHMRRNTYEETLFRVEDERFEIDMVIDSNAATLQLLSPIAEEIAQLAQGSNEDEEGSASGVGGKRFRYSFDKSLLGVIQRNVIKRIYGDCGDEMLDLMVKNPSVAIPVVVSRLRQKDEEWRAVRRRLNRHWRELSENNYYRSLDHRSLTWRTVDKRATSSRTLVSEIKDRAENGGKESKECLRIKMDKAKEEHGTFYEITMASEITKDLNLTLMPKPDRRLFTPHLAILFKDISWAQYDAYRILSYALERGSTSPSDKERCHRLWFEFLGPWFGIPLEWMHRPAVEYQESKSMKSNTTEGLEGTLVSEEEDEDESLEDEDMNGNVVTEEFNLADNTEDNGFDDQHPLPRGSHVSTIYGPGVVEGVREDEKLYVVKLSFGAIGYVRPTAVLCSVLPAEKSAQTRQLRSEDPTKLSRPGDQLAFGTQSLYVFFRLHQFLVDRLRTAKYLAYNVGGSQSLQTMVEQMHGSNPDLVGHQRYEAFLSLLYGLLDGSNGTPAEGGKYEDRVRSLLGHGGYELATMDKLIANIWKNLQSVAQDDAMWNLVQVYRRHQLEGSFHPEAFRQEAAFLSEGEQMYAFQHCPIRGADESILYIEYMGVMDDESEEDETEVDPPATKKQKR